MNTELQIFDNSEFGSIRTIEVNGKPYFCGSDVASALGYAKPNNAVATHCRATLKQGTLLVERFRRLTLFQKAMFID